MATNDNDRFRDLHTQAPLMRDLITMHGIACNTKSAVVDYFRAMHEQTHIILPDTDVMKWMTNERDHLRRLHKRGPVWGFAGKFDHECAGITAHCLDAIIADLEARR